MSRDNKGFDPKYDDNKENDVIYFSKATKTSGNSSYRKVELLLNEEETFSEKNIEQNSTPVDFSIKENVTLYKSPGGQQKIHCWLLESPTGKGLNSIRISRRTNKGIWFARGNAFN